jgi:hypothetical protein
MAVVMSRIWRDNNAILRKQATASNAMTCDLITGGDDGVRTHDLRLAKPALSQLSYIPNGINASAATRLTLGRLFTKNGGPDKV